MTLSRCIFWKSSVTQYKNFELNVVRSVQCVPWLFHKGISSLIYFNLFITFSYTLRLGSISLVKFRGQWITRKYRWNLRKVALTENCRNQSLCCCCLIFIYCNVHIVHLLFRTFCSDLFTFWDIYIMFIIQKVIYFHEVIYL